MTQIEAAKCGRITPQLRQVAQAEGISQEELAQLVATGRVVIPANVHADLKNPCGVGKGLKVKVNANLGTSPDYPAPEEELKKLQAALSAKADTVMDLSTGGDLMGIRKAIRAQCPVPLGTVPIYEAAKHTREEGAGLIQMDPELLFETIARHGAQGVDFITVHCGVTWGAIAHLKKQGRLADIVSRGGAFMAAWMLANERENPLYEQYDRLLEIALETDMTLSLGDGLRPGCLKDATDRGQISELVVLGELVQRAREAGVQVMVEGPGHVPLHQVQANVHIQKALCDEAPFYVLGPIVTDVAAGYDHVAGAIGGALAAWSGADFLCYVTPAEHLGLPTPEHVYEGVIVTRIAAHAADIAKGVRGAQEWDNAVSQARKNLDWETQLKLVMDPIKATAIHRERSPDPDEEGCSMCGEFCAMTLNLEAFGKE
ncbi:MAG: phosphomethylpyrimidine synthase ThiC [Candidatus Latescibacterota bacterium]